MNWVRFGGLLCAVVASRATLAAATPPQAGLLDQVLREYVQNDGTVRYQALKKDLTPLDEFVRQVAAVSPDSHPALFPHRSDRLAYWLNTYNALVLWAFAKDYPKDKDRLSGLIGRGRFFYRRKFNVGGRRRSLDDIETNSIRKGFGDPRIHFAIVCASASCPWLAREAFVPERLEKQLEDRTKLFVNQSRNVRPDPPRSEIWLSQIFEWFEDDFGGSRGSVLRFVHKYRDGVEPKLDSGRWKVQYLPYDWSLNDAGPTPPNKPAAP